MRILANYRSLRLFFTTWKIKGQRVKVIHIEANDSNNEAAAACVKGKGKVDMLFPNHIISVLLCMNTTHVARDLLAEQF